MSDSITPRILIVDDSPPNILILAKMLEPDYATSFATSGPEALQLLAVDPPPDLILLDVMMPQMDGYAVCAALKGNPSTRDIPVIFITARGAPESETRALAAGGLDFIHKPADAQVLRARIGLHIELIRRARALQTANAELTRHRDHLEELVHERTRELAQARDAAEAANRAKGAFLATMSHELRTPLNQIVGTAYLLSKRSSDEEAKSLLARIQQASGHLTTLISDILDYSNSEAERIRLEAVDFDLSGLLEQAESGIRQGARDKGLELVREVDPGARVRLTGDPRRLSQILGELLGNAVKFSERGPITLRVRPIETHEKAMTLRFEVEDQGIGIAPELRDGLFRVFNQGDSSLTRRYGGTGLGLALCQRLATLMAAEIGFTSTLGRGSTFWLQVRLPFGTGSGAEGDDPAAGEGTLTGPDAAATPPAPASVRPGAHPLM